MGKVTLAEEGTPSTPSSGYGRIFVDSSNSAWICKNDGGLYLGRQNKAITAQIASFSADTYLGLGLQLPSFSMQAGMTWLWRFVATKGGGTATPVYTIRIGTNQTTADTSRLAITGPAQTAVADTAIITVGVTCRNVGAAGVLRGFAWVQHNLAATGFANTPAGFSLVEGSSASFDNSALQGQYIGLSVNPGASGAWVVEWATAGCDY